MQGCQYDDQAMSAQPLIADITNLGRHLCDSKLVGCKSNSHVEYAIASTCRVESLFYAMVFRDLWKKRFSDYISDTPLIGDHLRIEAVTFPATHAFRHHHQKLLAGIYPIKRNVT